MTLPDYIAALMRPKIGGLAQHDVLLRERERERERERGEVRPDKGEVREKRDMEKREK